MKYLFNSTLLLAISISLFSCKKKGCTDCNATNYDIDAAQNDNSCQYINETQVGSYTITDSIVDWTQTVWYSTYIMEIKRGECDPNGLTISNYNNLTNQLTGDPLEVNCEILGDSIIINPQMIEGDNIPGYSFDDFNIHKQKGYFRNDSIFINISYSSNGDDPHYGYCWGKKN